MAEGVDAVWWSPRADIAGSEAAERLRHTLTGTAICMVPRAIDPEISASLATFEASAWPPYDVRGSADYLKDSISHRQAELTGVAFRQLFGEIRALVDLFTASTSSSILRLRLGETMLPEAYADTIRESSLFFAATYIGKAIVWNEPDAASVTAGATAGRRHVASPGTLILLRGGKNGRDEQSIGNMKVAEGSASLVLTIDDADPDTVKWRSTLRQYSFDERSCESTQ